MLQDCLTGSMYARSEDAVTVHNDLVILLPTKDGLDAVATATLSGFGDGGYIDIDEDNNITGSLGWAATGILRWEWEGPSGAVLTILDEGVDQVRVPRCLAFVFRLVANYSDAHAVGTVFIHAPRPVRLKVGTERSAVVVDKDKGDWKVRYVRRELSFGPSGSGMADTLEQDALAAAATLLRRRERQLQVFVTQDRRAIAGACRVDPRTGRIIAVPPTRAMAARLNLPPVSALLRVSPSERRKQGRRRAPSRRR